MHPKRNDPLHKVLAALKEDGKYTETKNALDSLRNDAVQNSPDDRIELKLKTRLFVNYDLKEGKNFHKQIDENLAKYCRCVTCNAILTVPIAVQNYDEHLVLPQYQPGKDGNRQATQLTAILKGISYYPATE